MKLLGLDVGGDFATAFLLDSPPANPKDYIKSKEFAPFRIHYKVADLEKLLTLEFDCAILEPSGGYEDILIHWFEKHDIKFRLTNLGRVKSYRSDLGIPKSDSNDGFILACYGFNKWQDKSAWIQPIELKQVRDKLLQRRGLIDIRRSLIPRLRQFLHKEFPEAKDFIAKREWGEDSIGILLWLAGVEGRRYYQYWEKKHNKTVGRGISAFTRSIGKRILDVDQDLIAIESEIDQVLAEPRFKLYNEAFDEMGFSTMLRAWWLCRIYPFEQFLGDDNKPIEAKRLSKNGKPVTLHISLSRFKATLGIGTVPNTSGIRGEVMPKRYRKPKRNKNSKAKNAEYFIIGDRYCREAFFLWADRRIVTGNLDSPMAEKLKDFYKRKREEDKPYYKIIGGLHGYSCRLLFKLLKDRLTN